MNLNDKPNLTAKNSAFLKADEFPDGAAVTVTISGVDVALFGEQDEEKLVLDIGKGKGLVLNKTNCGNCLQVFGPETDNWIGKQIMLSTMFYPKFSTKGFVVNPIAGGQTTQPPSISGSVAPLDAAKGDEIPW